jgi:hypothetical protein
MKKNRLKNEFCELGLSLKIVECDFYRKIEEIQCECREVDGVQSGLLANLQDIETQAVSRAISYLKLDFSDVLQRLIGLETEIDILEWKVKN